MKRVGYIPALAIILLLCMVAVGAIVWQITILDKKANSIRDTRKEYTDSLKALELKQQAQKESEATDKVYQDYFDLWVKREGKIGEVELKQKMQKLAEEMSVTIFEVGPIESIDGAMAGGRRGRDTANRGRGAPPGQGTPEVGQRVPQGMTEPGSVNLKVVLLGPFGGLIRWLERMENDLGGLRVLSTSWLARSSEEVRLTITIKYRTPEVIP